jgi:hypothetical protein
MIKEVQKAAKKFFVVTERKALENLFKAFKYKIKSSAVKLVVK